MAIPAAQLHQANGRFWPFPAGAGSRRAWRRALGSRRGRPAPQARRRPRARRLAQPLGGLPSARARAPRLRPDEPRARAIQRRPAAARAPWQPPYRSTSAPPPGPGRPRDSAAARASARGSPPCGAPLRAASPSDREARPREEFPVPAGAHVHDGALELSHHRRRPSSSSIRRASASRGSRSRPAVSTTAEPVLKELGKTTTKRFGSVPSLVVSTPAVLEAWTICARPQSSARARRDRRVAARHRLPGEAIALSEAHVALGMAAVVAGVPGIRRARIAFTRY